MSFVGHADIVTLLSWRATARAFFVAASLVMRQRYEASLQPYVKDVARFDELLRSTGAVVSGSVALRFFLEDEPWVPGDLDIYVPESRFDQFVARATASDGLGFKLIPRPGREGKGP